jgi:hypothetical protein
LETYEAIMATLALSLGASWASGINLYAALLMLGYAGHSGQLALPPDLIILQDPMVMAAAGLMYCVEFFADKTPGVDTGWDAIHTFIRIPAGALLAAGAVGEVGAPLELAAAIVGGGVAAGTHATKASARLLINTSPEPASNWLASITEDVVTIGGLWVALQQPEVFLVLLLLFLFAVIWLLPKIWRLLGALFNKFRGWFGGGTRVESIESVQPIQPHVGGAVAADNAQAHLSPGEIPPDQSTEPVAEDSVAKLERLAALRAAGDLTDAEFERAKERLLRDE